MKINSVKKLKYTLLKKIVPFLFIFMLLSANSTAQEVRFYAKADAKEIFAGSYLEVEFVLENAHGYNFVAPDFNGFKIISGPSTSTQVSIVNGRKSSKEGYSYSLIAPTPGKYTIQPAKINIHKNVLFTEPIVITVRKPKKGKTGNISEKEKFFIKQELSDSIAYPGQQIILKYRLYTTVNVSNYSFRYKSNYDGFIAEQLNLNESPERVIVNDIEYTVHTLETVALFPQNTGVLTIEAASIILNLPDKRRSRNSIFTSTRPYPISGKEVSLLVKPLPQDAPKNFSGNIGKFNIKTKINRKNISTDDAISLLVQISGDGLTKFIEAPNLKETLKDFEVYDPKTVRSKDYISNGKLQGQKTFEYLIVPLKKGKYSIDIPYTYFDTDSAKYITLHSNPGNITVRQGSNTSKLSAEETLEKYKLRPVNTNTKLSKFKKPFFGSLLYWILLGIGLLSIPILYLLKQFLIKKGNIDPTILKKNKANKEALKRLKKAQSLLDKDEKQAFYKEISDALIKYIADKLNIPNIELSKTNISTKLKELGVSAKNTDTFNELINSCEIALYAASPSSEMQEIFNKTKQLLVDLELKL